MFLRQNPLFGSRPPEPSCLEWFPGIFPGPLPVELLLPFDHGQGGKVLSLTDGFPDEPGALIEVRIQWTEVGTAREEMFAVTLFEFPITVPPRFPVSAFHGRRYGVLQRLLPSAV